MFLRGDKDGKVDAREANRVIHELEKKIEGRVSSYFKDGKLYVYDSSDGTWKSAAFT